MKLLNSLGFVAGMITLIVTKDVMFGFAALACQIAFYHCDG